MAENIKVLKGSAYPDFIKRLLDKSLLYAPKDLNGRVGYAKIGDQSEMVTDYILPDMSAKSFVFPKIERLFTYESSKEGVKVEDYDFDAIPERVVFGVRPCDAAGMDSLSAIFEWEPEDPIFKARKQKTTIIGMSCAEADGYCFCTSLGGGPGETKGSDILLTKTNGGDYIVEVVTQKGEKLAESFADLLANYEGEPKETFLADVPKKFDNSQLQQKMTDSFDNEIFDQFAMRCLGCSACAYVCPTCACFDIQDETRGEEGQRMRIWDSCGTTLFTLHTSGHNPRSDQGARWRQRLMHKFSYMPERLDVWGCVGCGRCSRHCPADMNITEAIAAVLNS